MNFQLKIVDNESRDGELTKEEVMDNSKNVFKFPPELLTKILLFCDGDDILNFAEASFMNRDDIEIVISNKKLWKHPVISPDVKFIKYLGSHTKSLYIDGRKMSNPQTAINANVSRNFMKRLRFSCIALEKLVMMNACLHKEGIKMIKKISKTLLILKFVDMCFGLVLDEAGLCSSKKYFYLDLRPIRSLRATFGFDQVNYEGGNKFTVTFNNGYPH